MAADAERASGVVVNIASGVSTSLNQLWAAIKEIIGTELQARYEMVRPGDVRNSLADVTYARDRLGFEPLVDLREGLNRTIASFKGRSDQ